MPDGRWQRVTDAFGAVLERSAEARVAFPSEARVDACELRPDAAWPQFT